jgi:hypothetical protein
MTETFFFFQAKRIPIEFRKNLEEKFSLFNGLNIADIQGDEKKCPCEPARYKVFLTKHEFEIQN